MSQIRRLLSPLRNIPRWLSLNLAYLRRWRESLPAESVRPVVLMVGAEPGHPYYESLRKGIEANGWGVAWIPKWWEVKISHQLLLYFRLCRKVDAVHLIDIEMLTLFGDYSWLRRQMSYAAVTAMTAWPRLLGKRTVYSFGDWLPHEFRSTAEARRHRLICSRVQDVLSVAPSVTEALVAQGIPRSRIWPHEHPDIAEFFAVPEGWPDLRQTYGIPQDATVILYTGLIRPYKGVEVAVEAMKRAKDPNLRLVLAGKPAFTYTAETVQAMAAGDERIVVGPMRRLSNEEMGSFFQGADYCVLPYLSIGHSGVLCQSLGLGVPVIASRVGSMPDYVDRGAGILFSPGDADDLAGVFDRLKDFDRHKAIRRGLEIMRKRPPERVGERLVRVYEYRRGGPAPESEPLY